MPTRSSQRAVRSYWDTHIHDLDITSHAPGSAGFFADLEQYHFEKLHHLLRLVPFDNFGGHLPTVYRGPNEYGVEGPRGDYVMQTDPPSAAR